MHYALQILKAIPQSTLDDAEKLYHIFPVENEADGRRYYVESVIEELEASPVQDRAQKQSLKLARSELTVLDNP